MKKTGIIKKVGKTEKGEKMFDYKGKVVAITGASSGLGKQMAEGYAQ